jgi:type 1 fimbriae regulatory protein FimB/type 1 fimbriae regulatory protein FimE
VGGQITIRLHQRARGAVLEAGLPSDAGHACKAAGFDMKIHPHTLRHACGKLANDGHNTRALQAYLGHKNIQHIVRHTELSPMNFKDFWRN